MSAAAGSKSEDRFLHDVKAKIASEDLSDGEEAAALEHFNNPNHNNWEVAVGMAAGLVDGMRRVKKRSVPDSARAVQEVPKRKAALSVNTESQRTKFHLTIPGKSESEYLMLPLSFDEEPIPTELETKAKQVLGGSCPSLYYSVNKGSGFAKLCSEDKNLPDGMIVNDKGYVELRPANATPNPIPQKPDHRDYAEANPTVFADSLKRLLSKCPHAKNPLEDFDEIPVLFLDSNIDGLSEVLQRSNPRDKKTHFLFAVTGSGKSRTVEESCRKAFGGDFATAYIREKLSNLVLELEFDKINQQHKNEFPTSDYDTVRSWLLPTAQQYLQKIVVGNKGIKVLHLDEVQCIMGHHIFNSGDYEKVNEKAKKDGKPLLMRDFYMPTLCYALEAFATNAANPQVVMTGTNFFSPVCFNPGSALKPNEWQLHGKFPENWVMNELVDKYFDLVSLQGHPVHGDKFRDVIRDISENRRVVQFFLAFLQEELVGRDDQKIEPDRLMQLVTLSSLKALTKWARCCARFELSQSCAAALGFCLYPEGLGGVREKRPSGFPAPFHEATIEVISIESNRLPKAVKNYANAGGLNIWEDELHADKELVEVPAGCLRKFLLQKCEGTTSEKNGTALESLDNVTDRVDPNMKGHLFERLFAFELTTCGSGVADVVCKKLSVLGRQMQIDAHIFGADWVISPTIMENWQEGSMHCVYEASNEHGRRKVDVGFPLVNIATSPTETWRVYCELKCGFKPGKLWELCWKFLQEMENLAFVSNPNVCAVFIAGIPFEKCTNLVEDAGPSEAKRNVLEHHRYNDGRFFILDGLAFQEENLSGLLGEDTEQGLDYLCKASQIVGRSDVHVSDSQKFMRLN